MKNQFCLFYFNMNQHLSSYFLKTSFPPKCSIQNFTKNNLKNLVLIACSSLGPFLIISLHILILSWRRTILPLTRSFSLTGAAFSASFAIRHSCSVLTSDSQNCLVSRMSCVYLSSDIHTGRSRNLSQCAGKSLLKFQSQAHHGCFLSTQFGCFLRNFPKTLLSLSTSTLCDEVHLIINICHSLGERTRNL